MENKSRKQNLLHCTMSLMLSLCLLLAVPAQAAQKASLSDLPIEGCYAISSAIGHDQPAYQVFMDTEGLAIGSAGHGLATRFAAGGIEVNSYFSLRPIAWGYGEELALLPQGVPQAIGNMVTSSRGPVAEWYVNGPMGLQQGFTLRRAPHFGNGPLKMVLALGGPVLLINP